MEQNSITPPAESVAIPKEAGVIRWAINAKGAESRAGATSWRSSFQASSVAIAVDIKREVFSLRR